MRMLQRTGMRRPLAALLLALGLLLSGCGLGQQPQISLGEVPAYSGAPYVELDGNQPAFTEADMDSEPFESYAPLDLLGRLRHGVRLPVARADARGGARLDRAGQAHGLAHGPV